MLAQLSPAQEALIPVVRQLWLDKLFKLPKLEESKAREGIEWLYRFSGCKNKPFVLFFDSPLACQIACNMSKDSQVWSQVWSQVKSQVRSQVGSQVGSQVESKNMTFFEYADYGEIWDYSWCSYYDYFMRIKSIPEHKDFKKFTQLLDSGIFMQIQQDKICYISRMPILLTRDNEHRMHNLDGPAIAFKDGYSQHYVHGVYFSPEDFNKFFKNKETAQEILAIKNTEQRTKVMEYYGFDYLLKNLPGMKVLHEGFDLCGNPGMVFEFDLADGIKFRVVRMTDSTTKKQVYEGVERIPLTKTLMGAISWKFGFNHVEDYCPEVEA